MWRGGRLRSTFTVGFLRRGLNTAATGITLSLDSVFFYSPRPFPSRKSHLLECNHPATSAHLTGVQLGFVVGDLDLYLGDPWTRPPDPRLSPKTGFTTSYVNVRLVSFFFSIFSPEISIRVVVPSNPPRTMTPPVLSFPDGSRFRLLKLIDITLERLSSLNRLSSMGRSQFGPKLKSTKSRHRT